MPFTAARRAPDGLLPIWGRAGASGYSGRRDETLSTADRATAARPGFTGRCRPSRRLSPRRRPAIRARCGVRNTLHCGPALVGVAGLLLLQSCIIARLLARRAPPAGAGGAARV